MLCGVPLFFGVPSAAQAEDDDAPSAKSRDGGFPELDSKYLFGSFTRGASVEDEGDRAIEPDTRANFGKRSGQYAATHTELELEYTPTKFLQIEIGPTISYYNIRGVPGLNDRNAGVSQWSQRHYQIIAYRTRPVAIRSDAVSRTGMAKFRRDERRNGLELRP